MKPGSHVAHVIFKIFTSMTYGFWPSLRGPPPTSTGPPLGGVHLSQNLAGLRCLRFAATVACALVIGVSATTTSSFARSVQYSSDLEISSVIAQIPTPSADQFEERSIDEQLILQMTLGSFVLSDGIFGFPNQGSLLLPLTDFVRALDFPIDVDVDSGRAEGWFLSENRLFTLDIAARQVVIAGEVQPIDPAFVEQQPDDIYVDVRTLARWFPVDIIFDLPNLIVEIQSREPIPLEARLQRQLQRERALEQRRGQRRRFPQVDVPYKWITYPVSDTTVEFRLNSGEDETTLSRSYTTLATADILKLNGDLFVSGTDDDQLNIVRLKLGRQDSRGNLLGFAEATEFELGDVFSPQITHMTRTRVGRGFFVTNSPNDLQTEFDRVTLQGDLQLGWEVELYRNEVLLDFREAQADGRYLFEDVPLLFGVNVIKLVFYGPQGQRREEIQQIRVGGDQLRPGDSEYAFAFNQQNRLLLQGDTDSLDEEFQGRPRFSGQYKYGVNRNLSVGVNFASIPFEGGSNQYIGGNLVASLGPVFGRFDLTKDISDGWAGTVSAQTRLFGISIIGEHTYLADFLSEEFDSDNDPLDWESSLRLDGVIRSGIIPHIPYAFNITHEKQESRDRTTNVQNRLSTAIGRASVSNTLDLTLTDPAESEDTRSLSGSFQVGGRIGPVRTRGLLSYTVSPTPEFTSSSLSGDWRLNPKFNARAGVSRELTGDGETTMTAGINTDLDFVAVGLDGEIDDTGNYSAQLRASYSWGNDAADGGLRVASGATAERGTMVARVFFDTDGDGTFTEGTDELLEGVKFRSGNRTFEQRTNEDGVVLITELDTFKPVPFQVDEGSLEDPFWVPSPEGIEVTLRPGVPGEIDFAIVSTGEIDGIVYRQRGQNAVPTSDVTMQLLNPEGEVVREERSQFDGFYLFDLIRPGTYTLRIDPEQLERLNLPKAPTRTVEIGRDGTILNGEDFVIGGAQLTEDVQYRVYLASFQSRKDADAAWLTIQNTLPDLVGDAEPEFEIRRNTNSDEIGVNMFAAPFDTRSAAESLCIELRGQLSGSWCNPLTISIR